MSNIMKKADIVAAIAQADVVDLTFEQLKKLTVKKLTALAEEYGVLLEPETVAFTEQQQEDLKEEVSGIGQIEVESRGETITLQEKVEALQEKDPTETNFYYSAVMTELTGLDFTPKHAQAVQQLWRIVQRLEANRQRPGFRARSAESVVKAAETIMTKDDEARRDSGGDHGYQSPNGVIETPEHLQQIVDRTLAELQAAKQAEQEEAEQVEEEELVEA